MRVCLNARQEERYLERVEEIMFDFKDKQVIPEFIKKYPDRTIILKCTLLDRPDWNELQYFNQLASERFYLSIQDTVLAAACKQYNLKFFFSYAITSYDELNAVIELGSSYVRLGGSLFFDMDNIHRKYPNLKIRLIPNVAYNDQYKRENGIAGTWVRPEDIMMYDEYVSVIEFYEVNTQQEKALYRIYIEDREWLGELNMLIVNFNHSGSNPLISSDVTEKRLNCRQTCQSRGICHICHRALWLANPERILDYKNAVELKYEAPKNK